MSILYRFSSMILLLFLAWTGVAAMQNDKIPPDRAAQFNTNGLAIRDINDRQYIYPEQNLPARQDLVTAAAPPPDPWTGTQPTWSYSDFGNALGIAGIIVAPGSPYPEIFVSGSTGKFGGDDHWYVMQYNPVTRQYDQKFASSQLLPGFRRMVLANVTGDSTPELVVILTNGKLVVYDSKTKKYIKTINTAAGNPYGSGGPDMAIEDIDGDGINEIVISQSDFYTLAHLYVYSVDGNLKWDIPNIGGTLVVGQMDSDTALEIAISDGQVIDGATHAIQFTRPSNYSTVMTAADTDGDGIKELLTGDSDGVIAYDVAHQTTKWNFPINFNASGVVRVADLDGDHVPELLLGDKQGSAVYVYDIRTFAQKWYVPVSGNGVSTITIADVDNDGTQDVVWGTGFASTGPEYLYVADSRTQRLKWQSFYLLGPYNGPLVGDLDGDGRKELVTASTGSDYLSTSARIMVFDAASRKLRAISAPIINGSSSRTTEDMKLRDVDKDGRMEILIASDDSYDGAWEVYKFSVDNSFQITRRFVTSEFNSNVYTAIEGADLNNDGQTEIIVSNNRTLVDVYSYNTGQRLWSTTPTEYLAPSFFRMVITDLDGDGVKDIVGITPDGISAVDSASHNIKGQFSGEFTDFALQTVSGSIYEWVTTRTGFLIKYRFTAGTFNEISRIKLADRIDAFTLDGVDRIWISSIGTLNHMTLNGTLLESYSGFGYPFAFHVEPANPSGFYVTGFFSIMGFGLAPEFDICIQDDNRGDTLQFSSTTGAYQFTQCGSANSLTGTGTISKRGSTITLQDSTSGRRVTASVDGSVNRGTATIQSSTLGTLSLLDRNTTNNTCTCP